VSNNGFGIKQVNAPPEVGCFYGETEQLEIKSPNFAAKLQSLRQKTKASF